MANEQYKGCKNPRRTYLRRVNSKGEEVMPTITATQAKGIQAQMDFGGGYVIEVFRTSKGNDE